MGPEVTILWYLQQSDSIVIPLPAPMQLISGGLHCFFACGHVEY